MTVKAAVGQICSTASIKHNLDQCVQLVAKAALGGAKILFLPEASDYIAADAQASLQLAVPQSWSPFVQGLRSAARQHCIAIQVGIHATTDTGAKLLNRVVYIKPDGQIDEAATYDKLHVFDYGSLRESATVQPGGRLTAPFDSPVGRIGSLICFDVRFAEPSLALTQPATTSPWATRPAQVLTYPSAFTVATGRAHWETLVRARAIETQSWVVAAAQVGRHNAVRVSYGHSIVVDPWGEVKLKLGGVGDGHEPPEQGVDEAELGFVQMDVQLVEQTRKQMPLQRRLDVYRLECNNL
ncbi:hypothetical protein CDD82_3529 [Ophiocordyceps australis]|uniref:CN hydrolase domain-containing protein n=1 Tax=Ophiocordyceps australis TaxID=1399860 RepID=A0A2C5Y5G7_9HYPO|nr:hypothetical protein CDD82_3529 [Ophiocordyceps australis]